MSDPSEQLCPNTPDRVNPDPVNPGESAGPADRAAAPEHESPSESVDDGPASLVSRLKGRPLDAGLYLTAMPIGNAEDITVRALRVLSSAAVIACEDTRHSGHLMSRYGIDTPRIPYHEHNAERMRPQLLRRMAAGEAVALISDAGTPLISDPGYKLVQEAQANDIPVTCLPGASAAIAGLVLSGLPCDRFLFAGFAPPKTAARRRFLTDLAAVEATLVFYESPRRLPTSLADMSAVFGPREAAVARELTKRFEEVRRAPLASLAAHYHEAGAPKGEVVVVIGPPTADSLASGKPSVEDALRAALNQGASLRDAVDAAATATGSARRDVYALALTLKNASGGD